MQRMCKGRGVPTVGVIMEVVQPVFSNYVKTQFMDASGEDDDDLAV